ncbi:helix-turn-helix domain-containing protein [Pedobacter miscanthi]|jgi:AraC-like DNA-binding protein|uniref:helix-turn-helix domain-containing protein n=1 Tax=Pedobacter miscanthi TaxID=2259170 RepID=UPI00292E041C|nr:helix-turn-helix domain-containing protein [Pedobacter miscanthi]
MPPFNMLHQEFETPEALLDTIKCFWYNKRISGEELSSYEVIPDGYAEIIFYFGNIAIEKNGSLQPLPSPFIMGLLNRPVHFFSKGQLEIIGIRCFPWTVFDLLGLPAGKSGVQVFEHPIAKLQPHLNSLISAGNIAEAIEAVKQYFFEALSGVAADSMLYKAGIAMQQTKGNLPVSGVAEAAHVTVRTLERNFKQSSGHTVKDVSGLMRFEQARNRLWTTPDVNLAGLAYELGYTDQSHFSREFKRYSGTTPAAFARNARKGKQNANDLLAFTETDKK